MLDNEIDILIAYIRDEVGFVGPLGSDVDLLEAGVLDSFNIVSLAMFAQERFGVEFDGEDLTRDNLATLTKLAELIRARKGGSA